MYSIEFLKVLNEERALLKSLPWYLRLLVSWGILRLKKPEAGR